MLLYKYVLMLDILLHECSIVVHSSKQMFNLGIK